MMQDSRVTRAISLLMDGRPALVDEACELMEQLCDELPTPKMRPVWCPNDTRATAADAAQHDTTRGLGIVR